MKISLHFDILWDVKSVGNYPIFILYIYIYIYIYSFYDSFLFKQAEASGD